MCVYIWSEREREREKERERGIERGREAHNCNTFEVDVFCLCVFVRVVLSG
jgi:hypothetical protein